MIEGHNIRLRVWRENDLPILTALRNDVDLQAQLLARARGANAEQVLSWLEDRADRLLFVISDSCSDEALGYLQVAEINTVDRNAVLGICLALDARGHGFGGESINLVCDYLRKIWGMRKIGLRVRSDNAAALRCYEKVSFERCGLFKQHFYFGGLWRDVVLMERLLVGNTDS